MTSNDLILSKNEGLEKVLFESDLANLNSKERIAYVQEFCNSLGLNFLSRPFDFIKFQGKVVLYANKGCAEQLRSVHKISVKVMDRQTIEGIHIVTVRAWNGLREDESSGAVPISNLKGIDLANALMKAETKAKRRATLSICSLNILDESEIDHLHAYTKMKLNYDSGEFDEVQEYKAAISGNDIDVKKVEKMVEEVKKKEEEKVNSDATLKRVKEEFASFYQFSLKNDNSHSFNAFKKLYAIDSMEIINKMTNEKLEELSGKIAESVKKLQENIDLEKNR